MAIELNPHMVLPLFSAFLEGKWPSWLPIQFEKTHTFKMGPPLAINGVATPANGLTNG